MHEVRAGDRRYAIKLHRMRSGFTNQGVIVMTATPPPERPLGPQELLFAELIRRGNGGLQLTTIAEFERPVEETALRDALAVVHRRHPMLRARIEDRDRPWWCCDVPFEEITVRNRPMGADFDPEAAYADEATMPLSVDRESWRALLLTDNDGRVAWLALTVNHGAVDGRSALVLLNDIDRCLAGSAVLGSLPLTPAAEHGLAAAGHSGREHVMPTWPDAESWAVECPAHAADRRSHVLFRMLPTALMDALHRRLHGEGIDLAAGLYAAAAKAGQDLPGATDWTGMVAPTDVRDDCHPEIHAEAVGGYIATIRLTVEPRHRSLDLLETARLLTVQFKDRRPAALRLDADVATTDIHRRADRMAAAASRFSSGLCVTGVRDLDRLAGRRVGISRVLTMPSQNHAAHPMLIAHVSTRGGTCLSIGYNEPLRSREAALAFADRYCDALAELAGGR